MEPEISLPHSQLPATCPYPESVRSSPYSHILLPEDPSWTCPIQTSNIPSAKSHVLFPLLRSYQSISPGLRLTVQMFCNNIQFYSEQLLAPRPNPRLEDHPLLSVRDCLFNIFAATLHIGGCSSVGNLRTCHVVVTGTHLPWRYNDKNIIQ